MYQIIFIGNKVCNSFYVRRTYKDHQKCLHCPCRDTNYFINFRVTYLIQ